MKKSFFVFTLVFTLAFTAFSTLIFPKKLLAWDGYDYETNSAIEIGSGNLVREGLVFEYFDSRSNEYRSAEVIELNSLGDESELIVIDLEDDKQRTFIME